MIQPPQMIKFLSEHNKLLSLKYTLLLMNPRPRVCVRARTHARTNTHTHTLNKKAIPAIYHEITHLCSLRLLGIRG